ncbi:MAG TPA: hypothetical protein VFS88_06935 [Micavibrio sp.]|nr:hypothetical protein [Micavibrio sp.]
MTNDKGKIIKANYRLQHKVGAGPLDPRTVLKSQLVIDNNTVDFVPIGLAILTKMQEAAELGKDPAASAKDIKAAITAAVMELKAHAALFHYSLIGDLANVMLNFLEAIQSIDNDVLDIINAHHDTLHMIIVRQIRGGGGDAGRALVTELQQACDRYYNKKFGK